MNKRGLQACRGASPQVRQVWGGPVPRPVVEGVRLGHLARFFTWKDVCETQLPPELSRRPGALETHPAGSQGA